MTLVERESQLAALHRCAADARRGEGRFVLVAGEAGAGKSALVEQVRRDLHGARWSWGSCDGLGTPRPLAPLFDVAAQLGGRLAQLCEGRPERDQLFRALLREITDTPRLDVLVVEDIHWADEATLDLLWFLARRVRDASVLVVATYRDDGLSMSAPLRRAVGELSALRWTRRIELPPLSAEAVRALAAPTGRDAARVFELTGGNPFYVTAMLAAGADEVPGSARAAIRSRVGRLDAGARTALDVAAVIGMRIEPDVLAAAAGLAPAAVDDLVASGVLVEDGPILRFGHELTRLAVEQDLPSRRRAQTHGRVLAALRTAGCADDARLAFHADCAGDGEAALRHATEAARRAAQLGSHREAMAQYERALRCMSHADPMTEAQLYTGLAREAAIGDRWQTAADSDARALLLWHQLGDAREAGETLTRYARALTSLCRGEEALAAAQRSVSTLVPLGATAELARAYSGLAAIRMFRDDNDEAISLARRAQHLGQEVGATDVVADALTTEGCCARGQGAPWVESLRRALELALAHDLQPQAGRAYSNLYSLFCDECQFTKAEQYYADGLAYCDEHDLLSHLYCLNSARTTALTRQGRWDEALALGERLLHGSAAGPLNTISVTIEIGVIRARRGESGIWESLDSALAAAESGGQPQYLVPVRLARAEVQLIEGDEGAARREAELAAAVAADTDEWLRGDVLRWLRRCGSRMDLVGTVAEPDRLLLEGRHVEAARAWDERGCPVDAAFAFFDAPDEPSLREALRRFDDLGAPGLARLARRRLRELGARSIPVGPRQATRADPVGLTPRERQVLDLICDRRTNSQIADALVISVKTVDHHVSAVLAKMGVQDREAAAGMAIRLRRAPVAEPRPARPAVHSG